MEELLKSLLVDMQEVKASLAAGLKKGYLGPDRIKEITFQVSCMEGEIQAQLKAPQPEPVTV